MPFSECCFSKTTTTKCDKFTNNLRWSVITIRNEIVFKNRMIDHILTNERIYRIIIIVNRSTGIFVSFAFLCECLDRWWISFPKYDYTICAFYMYHFLG